MSKELNILKNYLLYFVALIIICIIGASNVFAIQYTDIGYVHSLSGVNGEVTIDVTYETESGAPLVINRNQVVYTQVKVMNVFISNYSFEANRQYQLEMEFPNELLNYSNSYQVFGANNELCSVSYTNSSFTNQWPRWNWSCPTATSSIYLRVYNSNNTAITNMGNWSWSYMFLRYTNESITNDTQNTDTIINNANQNADRIIDNQNTNTDKIIEENKKNFQTCRNSYNLLDFGSPNTSTNNTNYNFTNDILEITSSGSYTNLSYNILNLLKNNIGKTIRFDFDNFNSSDNLSSVEIKLHISSDRYIGLVSRSGVITSYTIPNNITDATSAYLLIYSNSTSQNVNSTLIISKPILHFDNVKIDYEPYGEKICTSKLDEQKNAINNVDNTLKDDSVDENGVADAFESFNDYLDDNSTITQLITLPITLYTAILNNLNGTCSPFNLGKLYGEDLILPCINISQYLGNSLWTMIDIIISGFAVYAISKKMIKVFNNFSSLREGDVIDD